MVLEIATIEVVPGQEQAFEDAFRTARALPESVAGCHSVRMTRGVESPSRFVLLIEWESVRVHEEDFRQTDLFARWRGLIGPFFASAPHVEHYEDLVPATRPATRPTS